MEPESDPTWLVGRVADERLLDSDPALLPVALGRPPALPASRAGGPVVAAGATMTGLTLLGGVALIAVALVSSFTDGADLLRGALLALGIFLVATHWGWVHVAEAAGQTLSARGRREVQADRRHWLESVAPYARYEVVTEVEDDGSIAIVTVVHRPVEQPPDRFTFTREEITRERHSGDEPAARIAERVEHVRRDAAQVTERARAGFAAAADALETTAVARADEQERRTERRETARVLSEQLNAHLREPPLEP